MYQEIKPINKRKRIELIVLVVALVWVSFLLVDYVRYDSGKPPIFAIKKVKPYTDGEVREWFGIGYVYREYDRVPISRVEFVPFWVLRESPDDRGELPVAPSGYEVPENKQKDYKKYGLLYFYNDRRTYLGTYKCVNSNGECDRVVSGYDDFNLVSKDYFASYDTKFFGIENERFVFIDDSKKQNVSYGETGYERIIYLYDIKKNEIIAKYSDIKSSTSDKDNEYAYGLDRNYIVKDWDTGKWGIINLNLPDKEDTRTSVGISNVLKYEYDSITYDKDTKYYILSKDGLWYVYDMKNKKEVSAQAKDPIYDVWINNNKSYYFKTGITNENTGVTQFKIYKLNGQAFLVDEAMTAMMVRDNYFMYLDAINNKLVFMDYSKEVKYTLPVYFSSLKKDSYTYPSFELIKDKKKSLTFKIYHASAVGSYYDEEYIDIVHWK